MYRKGPGSSNLPGLDENPDFTCPDLAELPVFQTKKLLMILLHVPDIVMCQTICSLLT